MKSGAILRAERQRLFAKARALGVRKKVAAKIFGQATTGAGRPSKLKPKHEKQLHCALRKLQAKSAGRWEVTAPMLFHSWKAKAVSLKTIRRWLRRNYCWSRPVEQPEITRADSSCRRAWAKKMARRALSFWQDVIYIDNFVLKKMTSVRAQNLIGRSGTRGQYRARRPDGRKARATAPTHTKPGAKHRIAPGGSFKFIFGCSYYSGLRFEYRIPSRVTWCSAVAIHMFEMLAAAKWDRVHPRRPLLVLADNDPVWSAPEVMAAKTRLGIVGVPIPPRSPDCSLCDWAVFPELNKRVLQACRKAGGARSSDEEYLRSARRVYRHDSFTRHIQKSIDSYPRQLAKIIANPDVVY